VKNLVKGKNKYDKGQKDDNKIGLCRRDVSVSLDKGEDF